MCCENRQHLRLASAWRRRARCHLGSRPSASCRAGAAGMRAARWHRPAFIGMADASRVSAVKHAGENSTPRTQPCRGKIMAASKAMTPWRPGGALARRRLSARSRWHWRRGPAPPQRRRENAHLSSPAPNHLLLTRIVAIPTVEAWLSVGARRDSSRQQNRQHRSVIFRRPGAGHDQATLS